MVMSLVIVEGRRCVRRDHAVHGLFGLVGDVPLDEDAVAVGVPEKLCLEVIDLGCQRVEAVGQVPVLVFHDLLTGGEGGCLVSFSQAAFGSGDAIPLQDAAPPRVLGEAVGVQLAFVLRVERVGVRRGVDVVVVVLWFPAALLGLGRGHAVAAAAAVWLVVRGR